MEIDLERLQQLMQAMSEFDVTRVELEDEEERIVIERGHAAASMPMMTAMPTIMPASGPAPGASTATEAGPAADAGEGDFITSPFVGTFYLAPSPESPAFVSVGDDIAAGQTLCIVEAMKLMNEIEAEQPCKILEVMVENGKPVEYGARLFRIEAR